MFIKHIYDQEQFGEDWFTYKQLYSDIVRKYPSGSTFVEIGSWKGKSSAFMATEIANSQKNIDFYCIDTWSGSTEHQNLENLNNLYNTFISNMNPLSNYYKPLKMPSAEASKYFKNSSIDFIFIDASHEYQDVKNDILTWLPKLTHKGTLAGHDYNIDIFPGVVKAVIECLPTYKVDTIQKCFIYNYE